MTTTRQAAIDEMFSRVQVAVLASASVVGEKVLMRWQNNETDSNPNNGKYWGRASIQTADENQTSLSVSVQSEGKRRFTTTGIIFIQLFCPQVDQTAASKGSLLAVLFRNSFRTPLISGKVTLRNSRIKELVPEAGAIRFNVVADFEYDEII